MQVPAINYLLKPEENGPIQLPLWKLITWALGLCYFGVVFAVPLYDLMPISMHILDSVDRFIV